MRKLSGIAARIGVALSLILGSVGLFAAVDAAPASAAVTSVSLYASASSLEVGDVVTLTAVANENTGSLWIDIFETDGTYLGGCQMEQSCEAYDSWFEPGTHTYVAFVDSDDEANYPPNGIVATSNTVSVTWVESPPPALPSDVFCPSPSLTVLDGYILSVNNKLVVQDNGDVLAVCYRVRSGSTGVGGAVVVDRGSGTVTTDTNADACQTQYIHQVVLGQLVIVGTGSDPGNGDQWVCVQAGPVALRVIIPQNFIPSVSHYMD